MCVCVCVSVMSTGSTVNVLEQQLPWVNTVVVAFEAGNMVLLNCSTLMSNYFRFTYQREPLTRLKEPIPIRTPQSKFGSTSVPFSSHVSSHV